MEELERIVLGQLSAGHLPTPVETPPDPFPLSSASTNTPIVAKARSSSIRPNHLEFCFSKLDRSVEDVQGVLSVPLMYDTEVPPAAPWPSIFISGSQRSASWIRQMQEIVSLLPSNDGIDVMLDFFFSSLWLTPSESPCRGQRLKDSAASARADFPFGSRTIQATWSATVYNGRPCLAGYIHHLSRVSNPPSAALA